MRRTSACCRKVEAKLRQRQLKPQPCLSGCIRRPSQHSGDSQPLKSTCGQELSVPRCAPQHLCAWAGDVMELWEHDLQGRLSELPSGLGSGLHPRMHVPRALQSWSPRLWHVS